MVPLGSFGEKAVGQLGIMVWWGVRIRDLLIEPQKILEARGSKRGKSIWSRQYF